jgi:phage N-6-adenine-methyltransferase
MPNSGLNVKTAQRDDWRTPVALFNRLNSEFHFTIDAAADRLNTLLPRFWTQQDNALTASWSGERIFCNPPFSLKAEFAAKAARREAEVCVMILPATVEQRWFHEHAIGKAQRLLIPRRRIKFDPPPSVEDSSPRFASLIVAWYPPAHGLGGAWEPMLVQSLT